MEKINFKLEVFEGPLDLLLFLISKHKLNIADIEITQLLEQYLAYIDQMKEADLEVASEFLEMAARLVYIKTVSLLPRHEEAEALKQELTGELLELSAIKQVAQKLGLMNKGYQIFVRDPMPIEVDKTYRRNHEVQELFEAYLNVAGKALQKLPPKISEFTPIVSKRVISVTSRIFHILRALYQTGEANLEEFFQSGERSEIVATFLAVLELVKSKRVTLSDDNSRIYFHRKTERIHGT